MKKITALLIMSLLIASTATAQNVSSRKLEKKKTKKFYFSEKLNKLVSIPQKTLTNFCFTTSKGSLLLTVSFPLTFTRERKFQSKNYF